MPVDAASAIRRTPAEIRRIARAAGAVSNVDQDARPSNEPVTATPRAAAISPRGVLISYDSDPAWFPGREPDGELERIRARGLTHDFSMQSVT
jgi:hypothetical protein